MRYVLLKHYNPSYDFFLFRYFNENGIIVNENLSLRDAESIAISFQNRIESARGHRTSKSLDLGIRNKLQLSQRVFWDYAYNWRQEPDSRPSNLHVLEEIFGGKIPETRKLMELESQLPAGKGKLLFSNQEAAVEIVNFYKRYVRDPLKNDIDSGRPRRELLKYFSLGEMNRLVSSSTVPEQREDAAYKTAEEVLTWIDAITTEKVAHEMQQLLDEHWNDAEHVRYHDNNSCEHKSEYVELTRFAAQDVENLIIRPVRGFRIWVEHKWESDYADVIFPEYNVCKLEQD